MNSKAKSLKFLSIVLLSIIMTFTSSCFFSLGGHRNHYGADEHDFELYYKDYLDSIDSVHLIDQELNDTAYNYKLSFFNVQSVNEMRSWTSHPNCVPFKEYSFVVFKCQSDMEVSSISMYMKGQNIVDSTTVVFYLFKVNDFDYDGNYATYDIWKKEKNEAKEAKEKSEDRENKELSDYDSLDIKSALATRTMSLSNSWDSFTFSFYEKGDASKSTPLNVKKDDQFVLMFKNNMGIGLEDDMTKVSFCATNLLVASPDED